MIIKEILNQHKPKESKYYTILNNLRRRKDVKKTWNKKFDTLLSSRGYSSLLVKKDDESKMLKKITELCEFIDLNGIPKYGSKEEEEKKYYNILKTLIKNKKDNKYWKESYQELVEELGYNDLFESIDIESNMLERIDELCDFKDNYNRNPSQYKQDEKSLYNLLGDLKKKRKKKDNPKIKYFDSYDELVTSRGYDGLFIVKKKIEK